MNFSLYRPAPFFVNKNDYSATSVYTKTLFSDFTRKQLFIQTHDDSSDNEIKRIFMNITRKQ